MSILQTIEDSYILCNNDPNFSVGMRSHLRYMSECGFACLMELNPEGISPFEYLNFAKADVSSKDLRGSINGLSNAKKSIHSTIDCLFEILGLASIYKKTNFPTKIKIIRSIDILPTSVIESLNNKRNLVEHEYKSIGHNEVLELIDVCEMFVRLCYPFLKHMVIRVRVGLNKDERDLFWQLDINKSQIIIYENQNSKSVDSPIGKIYYDISFKNNKKKHLETINIDKKNFDEWAPYLNAFIYCTKKEIIPKNPPYDPKEYEKIMMFGSFKCFTDSSDN